MTYISSQTMLDSNEYYVIYQPIVHLTTGHVLGNEALLRHKSYTPRTLHEVMVKRGLLANLDMLRILIGLEEAPVGTVTINVMPSSIIALANDRFNVSLDVIRGIKPAADVVWEINSSEQVSPDEEELFQHSVRRLRDEGYRFAVDNLGKGYSSLLTFSNIEPEIVKIDRTTVLNLSKRFVRGLLSSVLSLSNELSFLLVFEGCDDKKTTALIKELGATYGQGDFIGLPVDAKSRKGN